MKTRHDDARKQDWQRWMRGALCFYKVCQIYRTRTLLSQVEFPSLQKILTRWEIQLAGDRPVACAGKKHATTVCTSGDCSAQATSRGPPLKRRRTTGAPPPADENRQNSSAGHVPAVVMTIRNVDLCAVGQIWVLFIFGIRIFFRAPTPIGCNTIVRAPTELEHENEQRLGFRPVSGSCIGSGLGLLGLNPDPAVDLGQGLG